MKKTKIITIAAAFVALTVVLKMFATVFLFGTTKFGFSFVPAALSSAMLGPVTGGIIGAVSDVLGYLLKPDGKFFPGFTISALIKGIIYGLFLFKKPKNILNILLAFISTSIIVDMGLNTFWINMLYGTDMKVIFFSKLTTVPVFTALQTLIMYILFKYLDKEISKFSE